jgi:hypothetical protein
MKVIVKLIVLCVFGITLYAQPNQNDVNIEVTRRVSLELLGPNSGPFMQPLTETLNATANARFFRTAEIPDTGLYIRASLGGMVGFVRDNQKTYTPVAPVISDTAFLNLISSGNLVQVNLFNPEATVIKDTTGLVVAIMKYLFWKGLKDPTSGFDFPKDAATVYGNLDRKFVIGKEYLTKQITAPVDSGGDIYLSNIYKLLSPALQTSILSTVTGLPNYLTLAKGANVNTVMAGVPQFEIGSLYGTELLVRFVPPIKYDTVVGKFAFWGIGLKHSINKYWKNAPLNLSTQLVYQGSTIENSVGATNSQLKAFTSIYGVNVQGSKEWKGWNFYGGFSYETIKIHTDFTYYLPKELQRQLGLLPLDSDDPRPPMYPGDQKPQYTNVTFTDNAVKLTMGVSRSFGPFGVFLDYSVTKFNIFTFGIDYAIL